MEAVVNALLSEISLRKNYLAKSDQLPILETIYFGGGTPSILKKELLEKIFATIREHYIVADDAEITLEANPDDLTKEKLADLKKTPVNRLSIGLQSFFDDDLKMMNRAHNSKMAFQCVVDAADAGFANISIDLIYGVPGMSLAKWNKNLELAFSLPVQHLSCYSLTIEKKTALEKMIREGNVQGIDEDLATAHFVKLISETEKHGFDHYEISNFSKPGYYSQHNSNYWKNKPYIGIGPSAHSYNGISRQWNVSSNAAYISAIAKFEIPMEAEVLSIENRYNEYLMTGLRTKWGVDIYYIRENFGSAFEKDFLLQMQTYIDSGDLISKNGVFLISGKGKLIADRIAARGFAV